MSDFSKQMCVIVTGASRGFGKALCLSIAPELQPGSVLMLVGRSKELLEGTKTEVIDTIKSSVSILVYSDFECAALNTHSFTAFLEGHLTTLSNIGNLLLIHNAGTVGDPSQKSIYLDLSAISEYLNINIASMIAANNVVLDRLRKLEHKTIVNISSLAALMPLKSLSLYCTGKAARDMFFKVLAAENEAIRVLSYAPGPLETEMFNKIKNQSHDTEIKALFEGTVPMKMDVSARTLIKVLKENKFTSGDHIDIYDILPSE